MKRFIAVVVIILVLGVSASITAFASGDASGYRGGDSDHGEGCPLKEV